MDQNTFEALRAMRERGGNFASLIAQAWLHADLANQRKLQREFGDMLNQYRPRAPVANPNKEI